MANEVVQLPTNVIFKITRSFRKLMNRFGNGTFKVCSDIHCAYCGVLSSSRTTCWLSSEKAREEVANFELTSQLHLTVHTDSKGRVSICAQCKRNLAVLLTLTMAGIIDRHTSALTKVSAASKVELQSWAYSKSFRNWLP